MEKPRDHHDTQNGIERKFQEERIPASWYTDVGSERKLFVMAPMVGQSDLPFRRLVRRHGVGVVYSEMFLADRFGSEPAYRMQAFGRGIRSDDHPLVVQFAANEPSHFVAAALEAQALGADAVDLNLGCPQHRARENHYGSWMTDPQDWDLCCAIIHAAASHPELTVPVTVKIRLQPTAEATVQFATLLAAAGASLVAVHGRQRGSEDRRRDGAADLGIIAQVVSALAPLNVPVLSNGNVRVCGDVFDNLKHTRAAGVMVAEHLLKDPDIFSKAVRKRQRSDASAAMVACLHAAANANSTDDDALERALEHRPSAVAADPSALEVVQEYVAILLGECEWGQPPGDTPPHLPPPVKAHNGPTTTSEACRDIEFSKKLPLEDGATVGKNGSMVRAKKSAKTTAIGKTTTTTTRPEAPRAGYENDNGDGGVDGQLEECDGEFERMSVWWTNAEVVKGHLKNMLGEKGQLVSRNTFKRAPTVRAILDCVARRFASTTAMTKATTMMAAAAAAATPPPPPLSSKRPPPLPSSSGHDHDHDATRTKHNYS